MPKPIGTLGTVDTLTVGGRIFSDMDNLIQLFAKANGFGYASPRAFGAASGYTPSGGKLFKLGAIRHMMDTTDLSDQFFLTGVGYADNDSGTGTGTIPTNFISTGELISPQFKNIIYEIGFSNSVQVINTKFYTIGMAGSAVNYFSNHYGYEA